MVTGATSGIGEAMVGSFARLGATVHVLGRSREKVERTVASAREAQADADLVPEVCDLADLDAVRAWCADLAARVPALHGLVHNAGVMTQERRESPQGHELGLVVHVLAPHLVTELLLPQLSEGGARVVLMSSGGMYTAGLRSEPDDVEYRRGEYDGVRAYARTKRMQVVLADAWDGRLRGRPDPEVRVEAATRLGRDARHHRQPAGLQGDGPAAARRRERRRHGRVARRHAPPPDGSHHFWHDRALRPTTSPWQREDDPAAVRRFLDYVTEATATTAWPR